MPRPYNVININGHIVPATYHDALKKILAAIKEGRVTAKALRRYVNMSIGDTCLCAIGALLTREQLAEILEKGVNRKSVSTLAKWFGYLNIQAMTAMKPHHADSVQMRFDGCTHDKAMPTFELLLLRAIKEQPNYPNPATAHTGAWHFPVSGE